MSDGSTNLSITTNSKSSDHSVVLSISLFLQKFESETLDQSTMLSQLVDVLLDMSPNQRLNVGISRKNVLLKFIKQCSLSKKPNFRPATTSVTLRPTNLSNLLYHLPLHQDHQLQSQLYYQDQYTIPSKSSHYKL